MIALNNWPGNELLLDYHADGRLSPSKGGLSGRPVGPVAARAEARIAAARASGIRYPLTKGPA